MLQPRQYQQTIIGQVIEAWARVRSVAVVCPTGGGKTVIFSSVIHDHDGASAAIVHRREIVGQISLALARLDVKHRVIAPDATVRMIRRKHLKELGRSFIDPHARAGVVSVQTLTAKSAERNQALQQWVKQVTLAVYDEAHHYVRRGSWAKAVDCFGERCKLLHVTATPERADGLGLGVPALGGDGYVEEMVEGPSTKWLIDNKFLTPFKYFAPDTDLDVSQVAVTASGDFNTKALRERVVESHLVGDVVGHYRQFADGKQAIVFATDVATAEELAEGFNLAGYRAAALNGATDATERERAIEAFMRGELQILVNVDLFDEGFDVPAVEAVILARPTQSLGKYLQMVGRALRILDGKTHAIIIDPVRNWERHGMPDWPRVWSLASREKKAKSAADLEKQKICVECTQPYLAFHKACPYCGAQPEPVGRSTPEQVDGDLAELDAEAMAALFERMKRADMSDDDYRHDQYVRRIPAVGRAADMRRHQAAKHRRQVLRELMAWWAGAQTDRGQSEVQRRFYYRFGVDMATALTLNAKETDELVARIGERFAADIEVTDA